jgi:hypothetical protein
MWPLCAALLLSAAVTASAAEPEPQSRSQYIFFNKVPHGTPPFGWHQTRPADFTPESIREIVDVLGTRGNSRLRIGVSFVFSILEHDADTLAESLRNLLSAAEAADVPVLITLDGQNWWETRPDLWNWWDPSRPGYDPENRRNVEWTGWGPEHAVKIGWRNWGRQIRVRPAPNIASPRVLAEHWKRYDVLVPIIAAWARALPPEKQHLFGGVKVGWEASINVNAYYYPDGNAIYERSPKDASGDPNYMRPEEGWTFGHATLGYAAVSTAGVRTQGTLRKRDIERVVGDYLEKLAKAAHERGIPRDLIFTHQGGTYAPWDRHLSFRPAINEYSVPGWSFYSHNPPECGSLGADLEASGRTAWAAAEWWRQGRDTAEWRRNFEETLGFRDCRFVCVYNWESFRKLPDAHAAVRELVGATATRPAE